MPLSLNGLCEAEIMAPATPVAADGEAQRAGLARGATAADGGEQVVDVEGVGDTQRFAEQLTVQGRREVDLDVTAVDRDLAGAGTEPHARHRALAATCCEHERRV